jgi:hypothetical protein
VNLRRPRRKTVIPSTITPTALPQASNEHPPNISPTAITEAQNRLIFPLPQPNLNVTLCDQLNPG